MVVELATSGAPLLALFGSLFIIVLLLLCVCTRNDKDSVPSIIAFQDKFRAITSQPVFNHNHDNGDVPSTINTDSDGTDPSRIKVPTLQRRLPDIPTLPIQLSDDPTDPTINSQSPDTGSELYATVDNSVARNGRLPSHSENDCGAMKHFASNPQNQQLASASRLMNSVSPAIASLLSREGRDPTTNSSGDSDVENPYAQVPHHHKYSKVKREHPYDLLKGQTSEERDTDTDNYDEPQVYAQTTAAAHREWMSADVGNSQDPSPPPVPEKRYDLQESSESLSQSSPPSSLTLTAANAVSGRVSTSDIPYVTSPLDSPTAQGNLPEPPPIAAGPELMYNTSQDSESGGKDVRYTSISVREPLANLRPLTSVRARLDPESYYSIVSDDDPEQTYAEIRSGQVSGNSSTTYARIEPPTMAEIRELPPVPPPVESLRSLASVHSRQASSSSTLSGQLTISSPEHDSHSCSFIGSNTFLSSPHSDVSDLYSTIDKTRLSDRRTIHVTNPRQSTNLEEMYAKVLKNKRLSLRHELTEPLPPVNTGAKPKNPPTHPPMVPLPELPSTSFDKHPLNMFSDPKRPKSMISYTDPEKTTNDKNVVTSSSIDNLTFHHDSASSDGGYEKLPNNDDDDDDHTAGEQRRRRKSSCLQHDPGYESILDRINDEKDEADPRYETLHTSASTSNSDPGYETLPMNDRMQLHPADLTDPGYETVNMPESGADPGYEQIKQHYTDRDEDPRYERVKNDNQGSFGSRSTLDVSLGDPYPDPDYEVVKLENSCYGSESSLCHPGYEKVRERQAPFAHDEEEDDDDEDSSDPAYERVHFHHDASCGNTSDPGYETVGDAGAQSVSVSIALAESERITEIDDNSLAQQFIGTSDDTTGISSGSLLSSSCRVNAVTVSNSFDLNSTSASMDTTSLGAHESLYNSSTTYQSTVDTSSEQSTLSSLVSSGDDCSNLSDSNNSMEHRCHLRRGDNSSVSASNDIGVFGNNVDGGIGDIGRGSSGGGHHREHHRHPNQKTLSAKPGDDHHPSSEEGRHHHHPSNTTTTTQSVGGFFVSDSEVSPVVSESVSVAQGFSVPGQVSDGKLFTQILHISGETSD